MALGRRRHSVDLDPRGPAFVQDPYPFYDDIRAKHPAFFWRQYGCWCVASHELVSAGLRDPRFGRQVLHRASREELGWPEANPALAAFDAVERHSLLELEPPGHTRLRSLINRAFVARQISHLRPAIAALSHRLIDKFEASGSTNLLDPFATEIPVLIIASLLGVALEQAPQLLEWSHRLVAMYQFRRSAEIEASANAAAQEFAGFLQGLIAQRRIAPRHDLVSALIAAESGEGKLTLDEMVSTCILVLNAGHEATVHAIGNGVNALLGAGVAPGQAFATPQATAACVEEILRFDPPLHLFTRYALEDFEWHGMAFRRGDKLGLLLGAANRDPRRFSAPAVFDPARPVNPHVSFGGGIHFCLGAPLARLELEVALTILFQRLPGLRLAKRPDYRDTYHFRQLTALEICWERR